MSKERHAAETTAGRSAFFTRVSGLVIGVLFAVIVWSFGEFVGELASYHAAKAYYDAQPRGDWDPSAHLRAVAFALHDGARTGAAVAMIVYIVLFLALRRRWGWLGFFAAVTGSMVAAAAVAYRAGLSP